MCGASDRARSLLDLLVRDTYLFDRAATSDALSFLCGITCFVYLKLSSLFSQEDLSHSTGLDKFDKLSSSGVS